VSGTLFTPSIHIERNIFDVLRRKIKKLAGLHTGKFSSVVATQSITDIKKIPPASVDYIFTDPPFGKSLQYAELNSFMEAWLSVSTKTELDCVLNYVHLKNLSFYSHLMQQAFQNYSNVLKPGRWITIEFHNSQNAVWNAIQLAVEASGLVVADVRILDKKQRSFNAVNRAGAVDQDLIISAYKPQIDFEQQFSSHAGAKKGAWTFVRQHLKQLPVIVRVNGNLEALSERQVYLLFDRMVAFHIQRGVTVPLSATQFYAGLDERFPKRDGMYFLPEQVPDYDRARLEAEGVAQLALFISDEKTAIQWLRQNLDFELGGEPQTYQDLQPKFLRQLHQAKHEVLPELSNLLEQSFLQDNQGRWYTPDPNKASDLEKIRNKSLLREFNQYSDGKKQLKQFRTEAVRAGFADAWQRKDFKTIVKIANRLPETILQEDPDLLMYYDNASLRTE